MISDIYWQKFLSDGSAYSYIKYTEAVRQEGIDDDAGSVHSGCTHNTGTADR